MELNPIGFCHFDIKKTIQLLMATSRSERICWEKKISAAFFNKVFLQKNFQVIKIFMKSDFGYLINIIFEYDNFS